MGLDTESKVWFDGGMETTPYTVKFRKGTDRYNVELDGERVGWVLKTREGWAFYATIEDAIAGKRLALEPQRQQAVEEGLGMLRIYHLGRVFTIDLDRDSATFAGNKAVYFDTDRIQATEQAMNVARWGF